MAYLDYNDYQAKGGALSEAAFDRYEYSAEKHIDRLTHGRVINDDPVRDAVEKLTFEIVEYLAAAQNGGVAFANASNEGVSVTYVSQADQRIYIRELARDYLDQKATADGVPLLYAGVDA